MHLFGCRPLAAACALFIFSLLAAYFLPLSVCLLFSLIFGIFALSELLWLLKCGVSYRRLFLFLALLGICFGTMRVGCERKQNEEIWNDQYEEIVQSEFTVKKILYSNAYGSELLVNVHQLGGKQVNSCAVIRSDKQLPLYVGDRVRAALTVKTLDFEAFSDHSAYQYRAEGAKALLLAEESTAFFLLESGTNTFRTKLLDLRAVLSHRISSVVGGEQGNLLAAMLFGSKQMLADQTVRDFKLSGVSHLLALSGLHLAILAGLLERLLYLCRVGKRLRIAIWLPLCFFYLMLTGCNYSLLRAIIMLGVVYISALFREDHDGLTSLFFAGALILLFTPYAIFSVSFQMTMLATLGILAFIRLQTLFSTLLAKRDRKGRRFLWHCIRFVCSSLLLSISTTVTLLPILWLEIGSYSLMTPLSNLLLVPLAPLLLFSAALALVLPFSVVGAIARLPAGLALYLTERLGSVQAVISLDEAYISYIVIPVVVATAVLLIINLKRLYPLALLPAVACMLAFVMIFTFFARSDDRLLVTYRQSEKNEGLVLVRGAEAMICDLSSTSLSQLRADWREAQQCGATELSVLLLTHYHSKSAVAISRFAQNVILREMWLPNPEDETERNICAELLKVALARGVQVTVYDANATLTVFDTGKLCISERNYRSRSAEPVFCLTLSYGEEALCYHSASHDEYLATMGEEHTCTAQHLILGAHGPVPKKEIDFSHATAQSVLVGNEEHLAFYRLKEKTERIIAPPSFSYILE